MFVAGVGERLEEVMGRLRAAQPAATVHLDLTCPPRTRGFWSASKASAQHRRTSASITSGRSPTKPDGLESANCGHSLQKKNPAQSRVFPNTRNVF